MTEGCSVCGAKPALCADKHDKATYYLCSGCLSERTTEMASLLELLDEMAENCPDCQNIGQTITGRQCEFCYETKTSRFNIDILKAQAITGKDRAEAEKMVTDHINECEARQ